MDATVASDAGWWSRFRSAVRLLWRESDRPVKTGLAVAALLVLTSSALAALSPILLKRIVDLLSAIDNPDADHILIGFLIVGYAVAQWLVRILSELRMLVVGRTDQRLHRRLSSQLLARVLSLPIGYHFDLKPGVVSQVLTNGLVGYRLVVQHVTSSVFPVLLELGLIGTVLVALGQPVFLAIIGLSIACYVVLFYVAAVDLAEAARKVSASQIEASSLLAESVQGVETIKYFCAEDMFQKRFDRKLGVAYWHWCRLFMRKGMHGTLVGSIFALSLLTATYVAAEKSRAGHMTIGDFVMVNAYMIQAFRPLDTLGHAFRDVAQALAFIERLLDLFRSDTESKVGGARRLPDGGGSLRFDRVTFSYYGRIPVLKQVSFNLDPGKIVAIVGPSGSGKSSLVRLLVRFFEPDSGRIFLDTVPISEIDLPTLRNAVAVVPQDILLFDDTVANNIAVGKPTSSSTDIRRAAAVAGIHHVVSSWPSGYQTIIGERGRRLSGGERQRIAIARAVLKRPRLLVFDEATSALDSSTEKQILSRVAQDPWRASMLVVAHRLPTIVDADEILVLAAGSIVDRGTHAKLLRRSVTYRDMWTAQQRIIL